MRIKGNIVNNGDLALWQSNALQADVTLYGNSNWSGSGWWNLSSINIQSNSLETSPGLVLTLNGNLAAAAGGSFNKINQHGDITLNFQGTANSTLASLNSSFYYGHIKANKTSGTVGFAPSATADNIINLAGNLTLVNANDRLLIGDNNTIVVRGAVSGFGDIAGGGTLGSLIIDGENAPAINPLRIASGTSLKNLTINRAAGVVLAEGFVVRENLTLNNLARLTLSSQTLVLGANGSTPSPGIFSGNGFLVGSADANISIRGNNPAPTYLRFAQMNPSEYSINNFVVDRMSGGVTGLLENSSMIIRGYLDVHDNNQYEIGSATLTFNSVPHFFGSGSLRGSRDSHLNVGGTGTTSYSVQFDQSSDDFHTLKSYTQTRRASITLTNKLNIVERVSLTGNNSVMISGGNLTLLSSSNESASIAPLINGANVLDDVNVQVYLSGNYTDLKYRGFRSLSTPINDALIPSDSKRSIEQLKEYIIVTGPGGEANGFDQGGSAQPFAQTLTFYNEPVGAGLNSFLPIEGIKQSLIPGSGFMAFFRGQQMGSYALNYLKLNSPYSPPEPVVATFKGPINKYNIPAVPLTNSNNTNDNYNGYNQIGNPFPSVIDWTKVNRSGGVNDEVIVIKPGGGQATYLNGISNNGGSPYIQTAQGFYVRTTQPTGSVSFREDCKTAVYPARLLTHTAGENSLNEDNKSTSREISGKGARLLRFRIYDETGNEETTIVFRGDERADANYNDAIYFSGGNVNLASLSSDRKFLAINFMPEITQVEEIPLFVNAAVSGTYYFRFSDLPLSSVKVFLKDSFNQNQLIELETHISYPFSIDKNDRASYGDKRFSLIFKSPKKIEKGRLVSNRLLQTFPNPATNKLFLDFNSQPSAKKTLTITELGGKLVKDLNFTESSQLEVDISDLIAGLYILRLRDASNGKLLGRSKFIKL